MAARKTNAGINRKSGKKKLGKIAKKKSLARKAVSRKKASKALKKKRKASHRPVVPSKKVVATEAIRKKKPVSKKKAVKRFLSVAERRAVRSKAAKKGWKKRKIQRRIERAAERERLLDARQFEKFERLLQRDADAERKRREREAKAEAKERRRLEREDRQKRQELETIELQKGILQDILETTEERIKVQREEMKALEKLAGIPKGYVSTDGSIIRRRMNDAAAVGMEDLEAQILAEEFGVEDLRQIYVTWKAPYKEYAIA